MNTIWCHPFSALFFFTAKDLGWKKFLSRPQLAWARPGVNKQLLRPSLACSSLQAACLGNGSRYLWNLFLDRLSALALQTFHRLAPFWMIHSLHASLESALGKCGAVPAFHQQWRPGRLLDLRLSLHTENMGAFNRTTEGAFMALRANQEGGCIGSAIWIHSERNEFCPVWVFCLIKGKIKSSWAGVWRKALAKVSLTGYFSQLSQSGSPSWWRDNCTLPCTMMRQLVKERNPFTVYFIRCMCRSLDRREELTVMEAHLTVGGATELRDVHSSHPAPFPSAWLHVLSGELRLIVLSVLLTVHSVWKFVWVTSPGLEAMDGGSSMFSNWFWSQGRSPCSYTAGS